MSGTVTYTPATFHIAFPEFQDGSRYPDSTIAFWLNIATGLVDPERWGDTYELGLYLVTAHNLVLAARSADLAARGGYPGAAGLLSSKSVGGVSVSYDTGSIAQENAGQWNLTTYGNRYIGFARLFGMGGVQIGGNPLPPFTTAPWSGPISGS